MAATALMLGVIGAVILVAALTSGLLERARLPQVAVFLLLGAAFGPLGLGLFDFSIASRTVSVVAVLSLVLVLFTDAVGVSFRELRRHGTLAAIILGPGTIVTAVITGLAAHLLLGLGLAQSTILGAALASTDPVLLRSVLRSPATPAQARHALRIESGMNDAVLLPAVLVGSALAIGPSAGASVLSVALRTILLGGGAGIAVGFIATRAMEAVRHHIGIRRDYESLFVLAIALIAFAAAESLHGSGFIAAFAAGLTVAALDVELCECFYDYGEASAEMALLFAFVILGNSAIWTGLTVVGADTLLFGAVALFARALVMAAALAFVDIDRRSRWIITWFGPRGLSSLLLVMLAVFADVPQASHLFAVTSLVVLLSVVIHGGSQLLLRDPTPAPPAVTPTGPEAELVADSVRISFDELERLKEQGQEVAIVDVRADASYRRDPRKAAGALRAPPERALDAVRVMGLPPDTWLILFCT